MKISRDKLCEMICESIYRYYLNESWSGPSVIKQIWQDRENSNLFIILSDDGYYRIEVPSNPAGRIENVQKIPSIIERKVNDICEKIVKLFGSLRKFDISPYKGYIVIDSPYFFPNNKRLYKHELAKITHQLLTDSGYYIDKIDERDGMIWYKPLDDQDSDYSPEDVRELLLNKKNITTIWFNGPYKNENIISGLKHFARDYTSRENSNDYLSPDCLDPDGIFKNVTKIGLDDYNNGNIFIITNLRECRELNGRKFSKKTGEPTLLSILAVVRDYDKMDYDEKNNLLLRIKEINDSRMGANKYTWNNGLIVTYRGEIRGNTFYISSRQE